MKKTIYALVITIITIIAIFWYMKNIDFNGYIKEQIEIQGSTATGQTIKIEQLDITPLKGIGIIRGISLSNPKEYKNDTALSIDTVHLNIDITSITQQPYIINQLKVTGVTVNAELNQNGQTNLLAIQNSTGKNNPPSQSANQSVKKDGSKDRIFLKELTLENIVINLDLSVLNKNIEVLNLDTITLKNIGGKKGMPIDDLAPELSKKILKILEQKIIEKQKDDLEEKLKEKLKDQLEKELKNLFQ